MTSPESNNPPLTPPRLTLAATCAIKGCTIQRRAGLEVHEDYDNTIYWCLKTMKEYGPDDEMVAGPDCRNPERTCYEPF